MRVAGVAVEVATKGRPTTRLVVIDASNPTTPESADSFTADDVDLATHLHDAAEAMRSRLLGLQVDRVVLRRADPASVPSKYEGPRLRLLTEGAITAAARGVIIDTRIGMGWETASWYGASKEDLIAAARAFVVGAGLQRKYVEAAAAAMAGLALP